MLEGDRVASKEKVELSPEAREYKKNYERWFYGVLICFVMAGGFSRVEFPLFIVPLVFVIYCLYQSQKNYSLYKAAKDGA